MEAETVADKLVDEFICRYGIPEELLTDRGAQFLSGLFVRLCQQLQIQKLNTTAYHPECNGANERMHSTLYTILRALTENNGRDWRAKLPYALFVYRNMIHKGTGYSPHQALFGYISRHECIDAPIINEAQGDLDSRVKALKEMREFIQARMEQVAKEVQGRNEKRKLCHFQAGDQVMLRNHVRHKLETPWKGPYTVVNRIGNVNYEIELPLGDRTHKIVHVQHLRPWVQPTFRENPDQPEEEEPTEQEEALEAIIDERPVTRSQTRSRVKKPLWPDDM